MYPGAIAEKTPDKIAYRMARSGEAVSYAELDARSNQVARALREIGLRPSDAIAIALRADAPIFVSEQLFKDEPNAKPDDDGLQI